MAKEASGEVKGHIGFTGTQQGMTEAQILTVSKKLEDILSEGLNQWLADGWLREDFEEKGLFYRLRTVHIGDCIGADEQFRNMAYLCGLWKIGHPPIKDDKRAFGTYDEMREPKDYLERNRDIVDECEFLIATPKENEEVIRSGTWSTIRYARKQGKEVIVIYPDGST